MDIKKFSKKDEEYFKKIDGKTVAVENVLMGDDEDIYDKKKYRYDLSIYDGPLDLLLYLVRRNKIEIEDIFVSDITQQYLDIIGPIEDWTPRRTENVQNSGGKTARAGNHKPLFQGTRVFGRRLSSCNQRL